MNRVTSVWIPVFEDASVDTNVSADDTSISQSQYDAAISKEREINKKNVLRMTEEMNALKAKSQLTDKEREDYDLRIKQLNETVMTKAELAQQDRDKLQKQKDKELNQANTERDTWKSRYEGSTINRSLTDAAVQNKAYNPKQLVDILRDKTTLVETLDEDGKPAGIYETKVKIETYNKDGKAISLELSPGEAIKKMGEMDDYANLFQGEGSGGLGLTNRHSNANSTDAAELARTDPVRYRQLRREGKITLN